jgi:hypothetical protein
MYGEEWKQQMVERVMDIIQSRKDEGAIDGKARIVKMDLLLSDIEARASSEPITPVGSDLPTLPTPVSVTLTDAQKDEAIQAWDDTMPDLYPERDVLGLLDAEPYDPDEEEEDSD